MRRILSLLVWVVALNFSLVGLTGCLNSFNAGVHSEPTITSFTATPTSITAGATATLTGVFSAGTGVINPGNLPATSGTAVTVTPSQTTTYILTVTDASGGTSTQAVTVTVNPVAPIITGFTATPSTISPGGTSSLTGIFSGGTGVITPGNIAVTSGTAVSVTPSDTTTYTLTVTNSAGVTTAQTATVTVTSIVPTITSFIANPTSITAGGTSNLTGIFANGTGVITPGNLPAISGTAVAVTPSTTTTYTLTVTPTSGAAITQNVTVSVTVSGALVAPTGLQATPGNQEVSLGWSAVTGATSYTVLRSTTSGGPYTAIGTTDSTVFQDDAVVNNTTYYYVVEAVNSVGASANSAEVSATPQPVPAAPTVLVAKPGDGQVVLTWTASASAVTYKVGRAAVSGGPYSTIGTPSTTTFTDTTATDGTAYYYVVYAVNPVGTSAASNEAEAIPIAAIAGLVAIPSDKQVALFWNASLGASSYTIYQFPASGCTGTATQATSTTPRYLVTGLTDGSTYSFEVSASNATGTSALSACVSATPNASTTTLPPAQDPTKHYVGLNGGNPGDWDGTDAFVDVFKQSRTWQQSNWSAGPATVDADGWPTEDASTVLQTFVLPMSTYLGTYKLIFTGQATVTGQWFVGTVTNYLYNSTTNTSTADVTVTGYSAGYINLKFTNTKRTAASATNTGFTNARLYRPGYPTDDSVVFTTPFLAAMGKVTAVRMMEWSSTNDNLLANWADRTTPHTTTQQGLTNSWTGPDGAVFTGTGGVSLEYQIMLCNAVMADCYFNIPVLASDDYVNKMALAIAFGTDGTNPYTSLQTNPAFPPLNSSLRFYLEFANENWNSAGGYEDFQVVEDICNYLPANHPLMTVDNTPDVGIWYHMWRYSAWRMATISQQFESVFGSQQMMTRVRPLLETQAGDGQATLDTSLQWLDAYAKTLTPATTVSGLLYGGGGSAYYGVIDSTSADPNSIFATSNYPDPASAAVWATDSMWLYNYGIKHVAYEGGPGISSAFTAAANGLINADPRMETMMDAYQTVWDQNGGDEIMYFYVGSGDDPWAFTPDINNIATPKFAALADIQSTPRAAVTLGTAIPGTLMAVDQTTLVRAPNVSTYADYNTTVGTDTTECTYINSAGTYASYAVHATAAFTGTLTLNGSGGYSKVGIAYPAQTSEIWVNGVDQGSVTFSAQSKVAQQNSTSLSVSIPAGLSMIRIVATTGTEFFCSLTVTNP